MELEGRALVFLDRDGTINVDFGYVTRPADLVLCTGAAAAIGRLQRAGFAVVVVSNQSAVGRGYASLAEVEATNEALAEMLLAEDEEARIDLWCVAPDHPDTASDRRKPGIGMLRDAQEIFHFDPKRCWMVGDKESDVAFGRNAGLPPEQCVLLIDEKQPERPYAQAASLAEAVELICPPRCGPSRGT